MSVDIEAQSEPESQSEADIRIGKIIWPKHWEGPRSDQQQRSLMELLQQSTDGLIVDCSGVEVGNSEIVTLLMRIRNHANKAGKEFVLFEVPDTLRELLQLCNLRSVLVITSDAVAAKKRVVSRRQKQGRRRWWMPWRS